MIKRVCDQCGEPIATHKFDNFRATLNYPVAPDSPSFSASLTCEGEFCSGQCLGIWLMEKATALITGKEGPT